MCYYFILKFWN